MNNAIIATVAMLGIFSIIAITAIIPMVLELLEITPKRILKIRDEWRALVKEWNND